MALSAVRARVIQIICEQLRLNVAQASKRADEYIKFMQLRAEHTRPLLAPSHAVDQVWRSHILDTRSYQELHTVLMPDGELIRYNPALIEQSRYTQEAYATTLSLLLERYGKIDSDCWHIDASQYKKLNIVVTSAEHMSVATAGLQVYCHKKQDVLALVYLIELVMGYTSKDHIIITGLSFDRLPRSLQRVSQTDMWRSATVRVTKLGGYTSVEQQSDSGTISSHNRLRFLRFCCEIAEIEVSSPDCTVLHCFSIMCKPELIMWASFANSLALHSIT
jgi:hypothetical protein